MRNIGAIVLTLASLNAYSQNSNLNQSNYKVKLLDFKTHSSSYYLNKKNLSDSDEYSRFFYNYQTNNHKLNFTQHEKNIAGEGISGIKSSVSIMHHFNLIGFFELDTEKKNFRRKSISNYRLKKGYTEIDLEYKLNDKFSIIYHPSTTGRARRLHQDMNQGLTLVYKL
jgi:hypothetical protein